MTKVLIASQPNGSIQNARGDARTDQVEFRNADGTAPNHFDGSLVTHYADSAGTGPLTTPVTPDNRGRIMRFVEAGAYKQIVAPGTAAAESLDFHATPGSVESNTLIVRDEKLNLEDPRVGGSMATALSMLPLSGTRKTGTIVLSPGKSYDITTLINLDECAGLKIEGQGGRPGLPQLKWKGAAGSGPMIRFNSGFGLELRNLLLTYDSAAYNGDLISCDHSAAATDPKQFHMEGCYLGGLGGAVGAASLFRPNKLILSKVTRNDFQDAVVGIKRGANYVTTLTIDDNTFARLSNTSILDPDNRWTIVNNGFEPRADGTPNAIDQTLVGGFLGAWVTGLKLADNYFADATAAGTWVKLRCSGGKISNNYMVNFAGGTGFFLERCFGLTFVAIDCQGGLYGIDFGSAGGNPSEGVTMLGGQMTASTPLRNLGNVYNLEVRGVYPVSTVPPRGVNEGFVGVASAAALTLPPSDQGGFVQVTGTTTITSVTASWNGRQVTLVFAGILTVTDGSNLKLAGNFVTTADDTLTLRCDGTNWFEVARSVN